MSNPVTIVTAFFDINRSQNGDGRTIDQYVEWIKKTLMLNCNLYVVTEEKFKDLFIQFRPSEYKMCVQVIEFNQLRFYKYMDRMKKIMNSAEYKNRMQDPDRIECRLPEYNVIQYSKFHCLQMAIHNNPFQTEYFAWMDAGLSRFFLDVDLAASYPGPRFIQHIKANPNTLYIQKRPDLERFPIDDNFIWRSDNLLSGGMFCGGMGVIHIISQIVEEIFEKDMLDKNNVNNEQLALAMTWKNYPYLFHPLNGFPGTHMFLFKLLSA